MKNNKSTDIKEYRRKKVKQVIELMQRAEDITTKPGELIGHPDLQQLDKMPAYPELYEKKDWEQHNKPISYFTEEFNSTLEKLEDKYPLLAIIRSELEKFNWNEL